MSEEKFHFIQVEEDHAGRRIDRVLRHYFPALGQGLIEKSLRSKMIRLNMKRAKSDTKLEAGDVVRVPVFFLEQKDVQPQKKTHKRPPTKMDLPKEMILSEDKALLFLNKPHGLAVQGGSGTDVHLDLMLESLPKRNDYRPSSVHRLDRDTSGCLIVAKKRNIAARMGEIFRSREVNKYYLAIVGGKLEQNAGLIDLPLIKATGRGMNERCRTAEVGEKGAQTAKTLFMEIDRSNEYEVSLLLLKPITGRTHQLRVHLEAIESPIIGDPKYASHTLGFMRENNLPAKLCLHSFRTQFQHPETGEAVDMMAPLPDHMKELMSFCGLSDAGAKKSENYQVLSFIEEQSVDTE